VVLRAACVLRSGGDYLPEHVGRLQAGLARHLPRVPLICLSDVDVPCERIPLRHGWPGWWSKLELMRPDIEGDLLYFDLDTVIVGDLSDFAAAGRLMALRDFFHPERPLQSALMYLPADARRTAWEAWAKAPEDLMTWAGPYGDQAVLGQIWGSGVGHWQDALPGQAVSFKVDVRPTGAIPAGARAVVFHGQPRPWHVGWLE
jgi:hypothetical protein